MDTERAERLKTFPSMSNRLEHPEYFTGDAPEDLAQTTTVPADNGTTVEPEETEAEIDTGGMTDRDIGNMMADLANGLRLETKACVLTVYKTLSDLCENAGMELGTLLHALNGIDEALNSMSDAMNV